MIFVLVFSQSSGGTNPNFHKVNALICVVVTRPRCCSCRLLCARFGVGCSPRLHVGSFAPESQVSHQVFAQTDSQCPQPCSQAHLSGAHPGRRVPPPHLQRRTMEPGWHVLDDGGNTVAQILITCKEWEEHGLNKWLALGGLAFSCMFRWKSPLPHPPLHIPHPPFPITNPSAIPPPSHPPPSQPPSLC